MLIIACDYHPSVQQIAWTETGTGECGERRLTHCAEAEQFYRELKQHGASVRVGIEATGQSRWFERLLAELDFELWIGDPARIRAKQVRKQKNDRMDAAHILKLMLKDDFPRIWVPSPENRDVRQLVWHRHRMVQMRSRVMNQLQAIAMNEGVRRKRGLWSQKGRSQLESLTLPPWTSRRRQELLELLDRFDPSIDDLTEAVLLSSLALVLMFAYWQPMGIVLWKVNSPVLSGLITGIFGLGWGLVFVSTLLINHFDLFGLRQVWLYLRKRPYTNLIFRTPLFYRYVRHPLYLGWLMVFWATPTMTAAHLLFAVATTGYILVAIQFEERDLVRIHGARYEQYRRDVPMILPVGGARVAPTRRADAAYGD